MATTVLRDHLATALPLGAKNDYLLAMVPVHSLSECARFLYSYQLTKGYPICTYPKVPEPVCLEFFYN